MFKAADLFDLKQTEHAAIFDGCNFAWEALKKDPGLSRASTKTTSSQKVPRRVHR